MSLYTISDTRLTEIADEARRLTGTAAGLTPADIVDALGSVTSGGTISLQAKNATPSESVQIIQPDQGYDGLSAVTIAAIPSTYIGSGITQKSAHTYTAGTADQAIAAGQYLAGAQTIKGDANLVPGNIKNGVNLFGVTGTYGGTAPVMQAKSATPSESVQIIQPDQGYDGLSAVTIAAIPSNYVGSGITRRSSSDLTVSGPNVSAPAGYYEASAGISVATAAQATPSVAVDPATGLVTASATQAAGYVTAGTKSGTLQLSTESGKTVTPSTSEQTAVSANEYTLGPVKVAPIPSQYIIPAGTKSIVSNGSGIDVTEFAAVDVLVPGGGMPANPVAGDTPVAFNPDLKRTGSTSMQATGVSVTIPKTGTYRMKWLYFRSNTGQGWGTQLHINGSAYGSIIDSGWEDDGTGTMRLLNASQDIALNAGDVVEVYQRARSSYFGLAGYLAACIDWTIT